MAPPALDDAPALHGPINKNRKKGDLEIIANALSLEFNKKTGVARLVKLINDHLAKHPKLANEARFQGLFAYRSNNPGGGQKATRTSADKAALDAAEGEKPEKDPTGAHKKLLNRNLPRDPPARTTRLNRSAPVVDPTRTGPVAVMTQSGTSSGFDTETPGGTTPYETPVEDEESGDAPEQEQSAAAEDSEPGGKDSVVVLLERHGGPNSKPEIEEVHIPPDAGLIVEHRRIDGGENAAFAKLSQLLPIAIQLASTPTKKKGGRLTRAGATRDGSHVALGSIEAILANPDASPSRYLKSSQVNSFRLSREKVDDDDGDLLVCRLFVESTDDSSARPEPRVQGPRTSSQASTKSRLAATTNESRAASSSGPQGEKEELVVYLRRLLSGPEVKWKKAKKIGGVLPRVKALAQAMATLDDLGWEQSKGGFLIPDDYSDADTFAGSRFVKEDVLTALQLGHSQAAGDAQLFKPEVMQKLPRLQAWYDDPEGAEAAKFSMMEIGQFKAWQRRQLEKLERRGRKGKEKVLPGKKRARSPSSESDHKGSKSGKKSKVQNYNSDDLDDSTSEDSD